MYEEKSIPFEKVWNKLKVEFIDRIQNNLHDFDLYNSNAKPIKLKPDEYITYYKLVYDMCTRKESNYCDLLYSRLGQAYVEYIDTQIINNLNQNKNNECELINLIYEHWIKYKAYVSVLKGIFSYLDRFYVPVALQPTVYEYGLALFQKYVFEPYKSNLKTYLLDLLDLKRSGNDVNDSHVSAIIEMYNKLDSTSGLQYNDELEPLIVERCSNYYNKIAPIWIEELTLMDYMFIIKYCLDDEMEYSKQYLNESTNELLYNTIISSLLFNQQEKLYEKLNELKQMFESYQLDDLKMAYKYLNKLETINEKLNTVLKEFVLSLMDNKNSDLVEKYNKYLYMIKYSFDNNNNICNCYKSIFKKHVNNDGFYNELLEYFHNYLLYDKNKLSGFDTNNMTDFDKKNNNNTEENNNNNNNTRWDRLNYYVNVYNLVENKSDFISNYKMKMCYRLLNDKSKLDSELNLLNYLVYDESSMNNLYKMLKDVKKSKQFYYKYYSQNHCDKEYSQNDYDSEVSTSNTDCLYSSNTDEVINNSMVLNVCNVYWPLTSDERYQSVRLNQMFVHQLELFKEYFMMNNKFKNLSYFHEYSYVELYYNSYERDDNEMELDNNKDNNNTKDKSTKQTKVICNMLQASLLLLFNYVDVIKVEDVLSELNVNLDVLELLLNSCQGLLLQVDGSLMIDSDFFNNKSEVNLIDYFYQPLMVFFSNLSPNEESLFNKDKLFDKYACVDSLIVKLMKRYKKLNQSHFLNILQNNFNSLNISVTYNEQVVLDRIKLLISKEYISQVDDELIYIP